MLDLTPSTVIYTIVNLTVMYLFLRWLLLKPVSEFLEKRRQKIHDDLDNAKRDREAAQELLEEHRQILSRGKAEAAELIEAAMRQADERRDELIAKAHDEAAVILERAKLEITQEQAKAVEQLRLEISTLSIAVAEKLLSHSVQDQDHDRIFDEVLGELEESYAKFSS